MRTLSVIILNYATPRLTIDCAKSVLPEIESLEGELIIVDNASPDDSRRRIALWREGLAPSAPVRVVLSEKNGGFASGVNLGINAGEAEFYGLLNSDTLARPGAFAALLAAMRADSKLGILGPKITDADGAAQISRFRHPTPLGEFVEAAGTDIVYRLLRRHVVPIAPDEEAEAEWIGFPCVLLRKAMIDDIGLLDERYFMYFEDCDYCRRAGAKGWKIGQCLEAEVAHFHGASSRIATIMQSRKRLPAYYYASRARYFIAWRGRAGFIAANLLWLIGRAASFLRLLALKPPRRAPAMRAFDNWTGPDHPRPDGSASKA